MKMHDLMTRLEHSEDIDIVEIGAIDGDVIGSSLFINILLSIGAFLASFMILGAILSFLWGVLNFDDENIWLHLTIVATIMIFLGYKIQSETSIFRLRLATYFMIFGKLAVVWLIYERIGSFIGFDDMIKNLKYYAPLAVIIAIINMYVGKIKLEIFFILLIAIMFFQMMSMNYFTFVFGMRSGLEIPFVFNYFAHMVLWLWVVLLLFKYNTEYKSRLPFYAFLVTQIIVLGFSSLVFEFARNAGGFADFSDPGRVLARTVYNLVLLAPSVYMVAQLQKHGQYKWGWQYSAALILLVVAAIFPLSHLFIILFCFLFGYAQRDRFVLVLAYLFVPTFIYQLYHSLSLTLDSAALLALLIGIGLLAIFGVVKYSRFETQEA